jgi:hypothetical protein
MKEGKRVTNITGEQVISASVEDAARFSLKLALPVLFLFIVPYLALWRSNPFGDLNLNTSVRLLILILPGILLHELLHGIVFALFAPSGIKAIRFGILWNYLTPYCHCSDAVRVWQYKLAAITPLILLGILPAIAGIIRGSAFLLFYGIFFTWAAGGDVLSVWLLRKFDSSLLVRDHPDELGFIVSPEK